MTSRQGSELVRIVCVQGLLLMPHSQMNNQAFE